MRVGLTARGVKGALVNDGVTERVPRAASVEARGLVTSLSVSSTSSHFDKAGYVKPKCPAASQAAGHST